MRQDRLPLHRLVAMLIELEPSYGWIKATMEQGGVPFGGMSLDEVLDTEEEGVVDAGNWKRVLKGFFAEKVIASTMHVDRA